MIRPIYVLFLVCILTCSLAYAGLDYFISSDDYKDGEEFVGVFLTDEHYRIMVEEIERNDQEFDWGWVKSSSKKPHKPKVLDFDITSYKTIRISLVKNYSNLVLPEFEDEVRNIIARGLKERLYLEVIHSEEAAADLDLKVAIVDAVSGAADGTAWTPIGSIEIKGSLIELEILISEVSTGDNLLIIRHQKSASTPRAAAGMITGSLTRFLK